MILVFSFQLKEKLQTIIWSRGNVKGKLISNSEELKPDNFVLWMCVKPKKVEDKIWKDLFTMFVNCRTRTKNIYKITYKNIFFEVHAYMCILGSTGSHLLRIFFQNNRYFKNWSSWCLNTGSFWTLDKISVLNRFLLLTFFIYDLMILFVRLQRF